MGQEEHDVPTEEAKPNPQTNDQILFLDNIRDHPFISVVERRAMLGWDERRYRSVVSELLAAEVIERQLAKMGQGRTRVLYQIYGMKA
jgi:hypothetical protein